MTARARAGTMWEGNRVTTSHPISRVVASEGIDVRQNGATQTETIDEIDRFNGYGKTPTACKRKIEARR